MVSPIEESVQPSASRPDRGETGEPDAGLRRRRIGFLLGPVLFAAVLLLPLGLETAAARTAAVAVLMACWWMTEALPLPATALLPLVLFPLLGILSPLDAASPYAHPIIFLFMGGFLIALAMERWALHRRIALGVVARVGTGPRRLVLGFMLATAFLSMWISNTATAAMMLPIGIAIAELLRPERPDEPFPFGTALMLGIAYAATIGGVSTLIGTPPNAAFAAAASELLDREVGFGRWLLVGLPAAAVLLPATWALLVYVLYPTAELGPGAAELLRAQRAALGPMSRGEKLTLGVFVSVAVAWIVREPKELGAVILPGLQSVFPGIDDSTIAMAGAVALFLLPVNWRRGEFTLDWRAAERLPWGVLLLFGGGLSLARAFEASGLSETIGGLVAAFGGLPFLLVLALATTLLILLTELTSNIAVATMAMPVLAAAAAGIGVDPLVLMASGALAASMAFMLPVGTPPNAIAFGTGYITIPQMVRAGVWLNLLAILVNTLVAWLLVPRVFG